MISPARPAVLLALALSIGAAAGQENAKVQELNAALQRRLEAIAARVDGVVGYSVLDLTSGQRFDRLQNEVFPTASTIKLAILYELFHQADERKIRLDEVRSLDRRHMVGGTGVLSQLTAPSMPLRDYATLMIVLSDNTATNLLIDAVEMQNVTSRMQSLGLKETKLRRRMIDLPAALRGDENVSTPGELLKLLGVLYRGDGLSKESRDELIRILEKPKDTAMRRGIPTGVDVANKNGTLEGVAADAGIVMLKDRPYIFAAMTTFLDREETGDAVIAELSRAVYEHFSRIASATEYGRAIKRD